jgi:hypothetical protein
MWLCKKCRTRFALKYNPRKCPICGVLNIAGTIERSDNPKDGTFKPVPRGHGADTYTNKDLKREGINVKEMIKHADKIIAKAKETFAEGKTDWVEKNLETFKPGTDLPRTPFPQRSRGKYYNRIRKYRKMQKQGLKEIADRAGVSITFLNKVERWMTRPRKETRVKIAEALKQKYVKIWPKREPHVAGTLLGENSSQG